MGFALSDTDSPYLFLWFVFLAFFTVVISFHVLMLAVRQLLRWRIRYLERHYDLALSDVDVPQAVGKVVLAGHMENETSEEDS